VSSILGNSKTCRFLVKNGSQKKHSSKAQIELGMVFNSLTSPKNLIIKEFIVQSQVLESKGHDQVKDFYIANLSLEIQVEVRLFVPTNLDVVI